MQTFSWKAFPTWEFPCGGGSTSSVFKLVYSSYTCTVLASVLRWVAFLPDSLSKDKPKASQQVAPSQSTTFLRSVRKQGTICGTFSEQCCKQCCDIKGGKGRGWNNATASYRFWILRKLLHPVFNAAAFRVLCKRITRVPSNLLSGCSKCYLRFRISPGHFTVCTRSYLKRQ